MKFKIRFVNQIVGFFIIVALASLVFVVAMLGRTQRWFSDDVSYVTVLPTAVGLSKNMAVHYRGFAIGNVKSFQLTENDNVEVTFVIFEEYKDRVRQGSMVELNVSPIGLGNSFVFYAGRGDVLEKGSFVPIAGSAQARELIRQGFAAEPEQTDNITAIMNKANSILTQLDEALSIGNADTEIGKIIGSLQATMAGVEVIPDEALALINEIRINIGPLLDNLTALTDELNNPDGLVYKVLDTDKEVYTNLVTILGSLSAIARNLEKTTDFIPPQLPQLAGLIADLRVTVKSAEDVLTALTNNPLLKNGVPRRLEGRDAGTGPRNIRF